MHSLRAAYNYKTKSTPYHPTSHPYLLTTKLKKTPRTRMFGIFSLNGYSSSLSRIELLLCLLTWAFWVLLNIAEISQLGQGVGSVLKGFFSTAVVSHSAPLA